MPNWCQNFLTVTGKKEEIEEFVEFAKKENAEDQDEQVFDFNSILPRPEVYEKKYNNIIDYWIEIGWLPKDVDTELSDSLGEYTTTLLNWSEENWGTKWNAVDAVFNLKKPGTAFYRFLTAWSPPEPVVIALGEKFPNLRFHLEYIEFGNCFRGELVMKNGEISIRHSEEIPAEVYETADNVFF